MNDRVARIRALLVEAFAPQQIEIHDDSARHAGHAGARDGRGHFNLRLVSAAFTDKTLVARHRMIYTALAQMLRDDIHALAIDAKAPGEL